MALQTTGLRPGRARKYGECYLLTLRPRSSACAILPLQQTGSLSTCDRQKPADSKFNGRKSRVHVDEAAVLAAKTVRIIPTSLAGTAASTKIAAQGQRLVAKAVDRSHHANPDRNSNGRDRHRRVQDAGVADDFIADVESLGRDGRHDMLADELAPQPKWTDDGADVHRSAQAADLPR